ncbi:MAG: putative metal-binding motif-containing protein [Myxococcota bacterium]
MTATAPTTPSGPPSAPRSSTPAIPPSRTRTAPTTPPTSQPTAALTLIRPSTSTATTTAPPSLKDCDDGDGDRFPGNAEVCDTIDNDCDFLTDDADPEVEDQDIWHPDCDNDGQGDINTAVEACFFPSRPAGPVAVAVRAR